MGLNQTLALAAPALAAAAIALTAWISYRRLMRRPIAGGHEDAIIAKPAAVTTAGISGQSAARRSKRPAES